MTGDWVILEGLEASTSLQELTLLSPYMLQLRSNMVRGPTNCLEMTARLKEKIKGVSCSFVFPVLLFLTAALAEECYCTVHI